VVPPCEAVRDDPHRQTGNDDSMVAAAGRCTGESWYATADWVPVLMLLSYGCLLAGYRSWKASGLSTHSELFVHTYSHATLLDHGGAIFSRLPSRPKGQAQWQQPVPSALAFPPPYPTLPPPGIEPGAQPPPRYSKRGNFFTKSSH